MHPAFCMCVLLTYEVNQLQVKTIQKKIKRIMLTVYIHFFHCQYALNNTILGIILNPEVIKYMELYMQAICKH